jgi:hypothetical protein
MINYYKMNASELIKKHLKLVKSVTENPDNLTSFFPFSINLLLINPSNSMVNYLRKNDYLLKCENAEKTDYSLCNFSNEKAEDLHCEEERNILYNRYKKEFVMNTSFRFVTYNSGDGNANYDIHDSFSKEIIYYIDNSIGEPVCILSDEPIEYDEKVTDFLNEYMDQIHIDLIGELFAVYNEDNHDCAGCYEVHNWLPIFKCEEGDIFSLCINKNDPMYMKFCLMEMKEEHSCTIELDIGIATHHEKNLLFYLINKTDDYWRNDCVNGSYTDTKCNNCTFKYIFVNDNYDKKRVISDIFLIKCNKCKKTYCNNCDMTIMCTVCRNYHCVKCNEKKCDGLVNNLVDELSDDSSE